MTTTRDDINMADPQATALRMAIARVGISNAELARRLNRPGAGGEQWVRRRTHGQTSPTVSDLAEIAAALGCKVHDLIPGGA